MRFSLFLLDKSQCLFAFPVSSISIHPLYKLILINLTRNALISLISCLVRPFKELSLRHRADTNARMIALVSLCRSLLSEDIRMETAYFEAVRSGVSKLTSTGKLSVKEINERISELLKASIQSEGVIQLFADAPEFSIFDPLYLRSIQNMQQKNLAAELLRRLLIDEIKAYMRTNLVKSELFSEKMDKLMKAFNNGLITNAEVIEELIKLAEEMRKAKEEGNSLGLSAEELAFYDAISKPQNIRDFYTNDQLIEMTHELTEMLRKNRTIDWQLKDQARARMRVMIKRLLKKYKYPPGEEQTALDMVLKQAERMDVGIG